MKITVRVPVKGPDGLIVYQDSITGHEAAVFMNYVRPKAIGMSPHTPTKSQQDIWNELAARVFKQRPDSPIEPSLFRDIHREFGRYAPGS